MGGPPEEWTQKISASQLNFMSMNLAKNLEMKEGF